MASEAVPEIVVGAVLRAGRLLVQRRRGDPGLEGRWELPGGKREPGESPADALRREVAEETGLAVAVGPPLVALCHRYPDRRVALQAFLCEPLGDPAPRADLEWVELDELGRRPIPDANPPILAALAWHLARRGG